MRPFPLEGKIVAGSANNQLAEHQHGDELRARNILYAPDYAINAGGVINISYEYSGIYDQQATHRHVSGISSMLSAILKRARRPDISTNAAAYHIAENCFRALEAAQNALNHSFHTLGGSSSLKRRWASFVWRFRNWAIISVALAQFAQSDF